MPDDKRYASLLGISYRVKGLGKYMGFVSLVVANKRFCNNSTLSVSLMHNMGAMFNIGQGGKPQGRQDAPIALVLKQVGEDGSLLARRATSAMPTCYRIVVAASSEEAGGASQGEDRS